MKLTYKYRIYPTRSQQTRLENMFSMCRHLYNWNLQERIEIYEKEKKTITYREQQNALPALKKERPWFTSVYSQVLQDVLGRLEKSYQQFFRQKKGFPKYKKKGQLNSITYTQFRNKPLDNTVIIPKVGKVKLVYHRSLPEDAVLKTLTLIKDAGKWFVCFSIECNDRSEPKPKQNKVIGIDLGINNFVYTSNNEAISAPKYLYQSFKRIKLLQRKLSLQKKRTPRYLKLLRVLQKAHYRLRCKRLAFFYTLAHHLLEQADILCLEDLNIANMVKRPKPKQDEATKEFLPNGASQKSGLNRSIYDAGWGMFVNILKHLAHKLGKQLVFVPPQYTSQTCSECGAIVEKTLSTRTHHCHSCNYIADRDYNAAKNILRLGLESLGFALEAPTIMLCI